MRQQGGLNKVNYINVEKSLKAALVKRLCNAVDSNWCTFLNLNGDRY